MKSIPFILLFSFLYANSTFAQIGVKAGVHTFDINNPREIIFPRETTLSYSEANLGFQAGLYGRIKLGGLFLEPGVMLNSTKVEYRLDGENGNLGQQLRSETFTNLDIPVLLGLNVLFLDLTLGPVAHLHLNSISDLTDFDGYSSRFSTADYGWRAGIGTSIGKLNIGLEYEGNFSEFGDHITIAGQEFSFGSNPSRILLNVGFRLW